MFSVNLWHKYVYKHILDSNMVDVDYSSVKNFRDQLIFVLYYFVVENGSKMFASIYPTYIYIYTRLSQINASHSCRHLISLKCLHLWNRFVFYRAAVTFLVEFSKNRLAFSTSLESARYWEWTTDWYIADCWTRTLPIEQLIQLKRTKIKKKNIDNIINNCAYFFVTALTNLFFFNPNWNW